MKSIFVATDGSEGGKRAVTFAAELAAACHCPVSIVTVSGPEPGAEWRRFAHMEHMTKGDLIDMEAQDTLRDAKQQVATADAAAGKRHALVGDPAEEILTLVERHKPDLLIVGRRGRSRLAGLLLGSVSQKLVNLSTVPVTVVP